MRLRRNVVQLSGVLLAGLAIWGGPGWAAERSDATAARAKITKIKVLLGHRRNTLYGAVYSHSIGCVGGRRARVFAVTGGDRRLLDTNRSVRGGSIGYFRLALGRFRWNQTYRVVIPPRRVGRLRCEGDRQTYRVNCDRDAVLDRGLPTTNCYPMPEGPAAYEGTVTTTYETGGLTQVLTAAVRFTRIAKPGNSNAQGDLHEATLAYQTAPGTLNWTESGTHRDTGCTSQGAGQISVGPNFPDAGAQPPDPYWARLVFELGTLRPAPGVRYHVESIGYDYGDVTWTCKGTPGHSVTKLFPGWFDFAGSLYGNGSVFVEGVHTEPVRDDGTLAGVHTLDSTQNQGNSDSTARVEWSLHPAE